MIRLGVNIDHVATLRNARGGSHPDPVLAAHEAVRYGANGITAHLREDRRHIRDADMARLKAELTVPLNFEMAATDEMVSIASALRPHACCLVPERRQEVTTEGGLDVLAQMEGLAPKISHLKAANIRVSLFIDPDEAQIRAASTLGAPVIELHTGAYAESASDEALTRLRNAANLALSLGLELHAGHGLTTANIGPIAALSGLRELNIGHFIIGEAVFVGLGQAITLMRLAIDKGEGERDRE